VLFNSIAFLIFAPSFFLVYFILTGRARLVLVVASSYFFYAWWDWRFTSLLMLSTIVDYLIGLRLSQTKNQRHRRLLLMGSLCSNLGMLATFKYFDFFSSSFQQLMQSFGWDPSAPVLQLILPVGISFYTFQTLSYTIDIYRGQMAPEKSLLRFSAYVALFPQLVAGPIVRASHLLPQLRISKRFNTENMVRGIEMVIWGFFLKLCLADAAATVVDPRFEAPELFGSLSHLIGIICFSFQIYGDFAGYSLIAIGLGRMMGFDFGINFNRPYFSQSFSEFWQRWHISLSSWLRDYLYIPLGGNRKGRLFTFRNLVITMGLGGLWHGAGINFIIWGLLHGAYLVLQRLLSAPYALLVKTLHLPQILSRLTLMILVFSLTTFAWIFFRADNLDQATTIIKIIIDLNDLKIHAGEQQIAILKTALLIAIVILIDALSSISHIKSAYMTNSLYRIVGSAATIWGILLLGTFDGASFIYFQF